MRYATLTFDVERRKFCGFNNWDYLIRRRPFVVVMMAMVMTVMAVVIVVVMFVIGVVVGIVVMVVIRFVMVVG